MRRCKGVIAHIGSNLPVPSSHLGFERANALLLGGQRFANHWPIAFSDVPAAHGKRQEIDPSL